MRRTLVVAPLLLVIGFAAAAQEKGKASTANVYKTWVKSTAWIVIPKGSRAATGSGSYIDAEQRLVLTNYHVVRDDETAFVQFPRFEKTGAILNERTLYLREVSAGAAPKGKVIAKDPKRDLALIKLDAPPKGLLPMRLARDGVGPSDRIHTIGNPGVSGGLFAYTPGDVKNIVNINFTTRSRLSDEGSFKVQARMIENTAPTNEGDSGGPVLNDAGELVGVTQGYQAGEGARAVSYAVDLSEVKTFLKDQKLGRLLHAPPSSVTVVSDSPKVPAAPDPKAEAARKEATAAFKVRSARELIAEGKTDKARGRLEEVVKDYPDTKAAEDARKLLDELKSP